MIWGQDHNSIFKVIDANVSGQMILSSIRYYMLWRESKGYTELGSCEPAPYLKANVENDNILTSHSISRSILPTTVIPLL